MKLRIRVITCLLAGTTLATATSTLLAQNEAQSAANADGPDPETQSAGSDPIVVTGTRIRGARAISETISLDREAIVDAGQVDLGEAIRALPQNFSGGQNPGAGSGAGLVNQNINSASSANLRGLGADATLTLLNGHRLPYNSAFQGVDISAIPLAAVERVDVVPDGASALYGSDAVGGVINVVLRRDFDGVATSAQFGVSTGGGNFRQQVDIVAGTTWSRGGFMVAYDFANNSEIEAHQRSYASSLIPATSLYPTIQRHAVTLAAHHEITPDIELSLDALYSKRSSSFLAGTPELEIARDPSVDGYTLAPSALIDIGSGWEGRVLGVFGRDRTRYRTTFSPADGSLRVASGRYFNEVTSLEAGAEGPLFSLPGGDARLAIGLGLRNTSLDFEAVETARSFAFDVTQRARFAYAELYLPLVSASNGIAGIHQLTLSGAVRYEDYPGLDSLAVPRIAANYSPVDGLSLRGSWARSFKAPTLYQQYVAYETILLPAFFFGAGTGSETVLYASGGNPEVQAERARSWTAGIEWSPKGAENLVLSATWYDIDFNDRVTVPISGSIGSAFSNPGYADIVDRSPDTASLVDLITGAPFGLENFTGAPFDPADVVAFVDNRNINVAAWAVRGIDARIAWSRDFDDDQSIGLDVAGTWIDSSQQLSEQLPEVQLAGAVFNPPSYRARGSARYRAGPVRATLSVNYIGSLEDQRFAEIQRLSPSATVDLGLSYTIIAGEDRDPGLEISLTVQNLLDDEPETIGQSGPTDTPYDATNYSPIGRFVAVGIRRKW